MAHRVPPSRPDSQRSGAGRVVGGAAAAVLMVVCCAAPVLLAAGVLGAVGAWLSSPWVIVIAVALVGCAVIATIAHRRTSR